jgi:nucleotide-binding universal stress UspA family protein
MFARVLVPLDGSALAEAALEKLPNLVGPQTEVILLRVVEPSRGSRRVSAVPSPIGILSPRSLDQGPTNDPDLETALPEDTPPHINEAVRYLDGKAIALRHGGTRVQTLVLEESAVGQAIVDVAQGESVDLIVMSTHGRSGVARWVLGSVADRVLHATDIPITLVRPSRPVS